MAKHTLKMLRCEHHKILKTCLTQAWVSNFSLNWSYVTCKLPCLGAWLALLNFPQLSSSLSKHSLEILSTITANKNNYLCQQLWELKRNKKIGCSPHTAQKMKFSIKDFFSKFEQILNGKVHFCRTN